MQPQKPSPDDINHMAQRALHGATEATATLSRRSVLAFGGLLVTQMLEQPIMDAHYGVNGTDVMVAGGIEYAKITPDAALTSQGWGVTYGLGVPNALRRHKVYDQSFPIGYYRFSNAAVTSQDIAASGQKFASRFGVERLDLHGVSEGGIISHLGALGAQKELRLVSMNDSPFDLDDVRHATGARFVALLDKLGYHGDLLGKYVTCLLEEYDAHGLSGLLNSDEALQNTWAGGDPRMMVSQLRLLAETNFDKQRAQFKGIITENTHAIMLITEDESTDKLVKDYQAYQKWQSFYSHFGAHFDMILIPQPGHALTNPGIQVSAAHMRAILDKQR